MQTLQKASECWKTSILYKIKATQQNPPHTHTHTHQDKQTKKQKQPEI